MTDHEITELRRYLAYFTECQMATVEWMPVRLGKYARSRQQKITDDMLAACLRHGVTAEDCRVSQAPRTGRWLEQQRTAADA